MKRSPLLLILTLTFLVVGSAPSKASTNQSVIQLAPASTTSAPSFGDDAKVSTDMKYSDGQGPCFPFKKFPGYSDCYEYFISPPQLLPAWKVITHSFYT